MPGTLVITTLSDGTNSTSATNCIQGSAKAWANINGTPTASIRASYNFSSITTNGTGDWTFNLTNALSDANYSIVMGTTAQYGVQWGIINANVGTGSATEVAPTASSFRVMTVVPGSARFDSKYIYVALFR
jgi:hypothetical protein